MDGNARKENHAERAFTLKAYLADCAPALGLMALGMAALALVCRLQGLGVEGSALACAIMAAAAATGVAWDYLRKRQHYRDTRELVDALDKARYYAALTEEPDFLDGRLAHEAIVHLLASADTELSETREQARAYREYVELWVHEAKTPIAAAKLVLADMHGPQALKLAREIERVEGQVEQALFFARSSSLANDYVIRDVILKDVAADAVKRNAHLLIEKGVSVNMRVPNDEHVLTDPTWTAFVLSQAVVNAAKYGARTLRISAWTEEAQTPRARTVLELADDGCGIPAADVPRVFDRGFTGENGRAFGQATGMGLHLAAVLCERMGLGLAIASEEGKGTRVMVSFPHDRRRLS